MGTQCIGVLSMDVGNLGVQGPALHVVARCAAEVDIVVGRHTWVYKNRSGLPEGKLQN